MLERIHDLVLEQPRAIERSEKILFHLRKTATGNRRPRDEYQFHRLREFMLVQPETFAEQAPGAAALNRSADFFARHHTQPWRAGGQFVPVGDEAALREPFALLPHPREIPALPEARGASQPQAFRRFRGHGA